MNPKNTIHATYVAPGNDQGKKFTWKYYRDPKHGWFLIDFDGYERSLGKTWAESVPRIREILWNHGMQANVS